MIALITAGETIFFLPFVLARVFRPTLLDVFNLTNFELGIIFSVYGVVAMFSYFIGGPLADKFSARKLISGALAATAFGGLFMATIPSLGSMKFLYAFWGLTTILLFWAALIRATREWGGEKLQGRAFGLLEGGRGLAAALIGSVAVVIFAALLPANVDEATLILKTKAFQQVILFISFFSFLIAVLVYFALPPAGINKHKSSKKISLKEVGKVMTMPVVWLQAIIIICAYVGYKATDDFSLYARDVLHFDDVKAASVGTIALWMRPVVAVSAGLLADYFSASKMIIYSFLLMLIGGIIFGSGILNAGIFWFFFVTIVTISIGIYALRGLYFAIMEEGKIPLAFTGTAVGIISVLGYTPDIFMGPLMGYLLDRTPGSIGHQHVFIVLAGFSLIGLVTALLFRRITTSFIKK
ncbi:MAG: MFS transporter [Bacteroidota bacterium]